MEIINLNNLNLNTLNDNLLFSSLYTLADSTIQGIGEELFKLSIINIGKYLYKYYTSNIIKNKIKEIQIRNLYILKICLDMIINCTKTYTIIQQLELYIIILNILERKINEIKFYELYLYNYYSYKLKPVINNIIQYITNINTYIEYVYNLYPSINIQYHKLLNTNFSYYYNIIIKYLDTCSYESKKEKANRISLIFELINIELDNLINLLDDKININDTVKCNCIPLQLLYDKVNNKPIRYMTRPSSFEIIISNQPIINLLKKYKFNLKFLSKLKINYNCLENKNIIELFLCNIAIIIDYILPNIKLVISDNIINEIKLELLYINDYFIKLLNNINNCNLIYINITNNPIIYIPQVLLTDLLNISHLQYLSESHNFIFDPIDNNIINKLTNINNNIDKLFI
jgi:hypothetical protein